MPWYRLAYLPAVVADLAGLDKDLAQRLLDKTKWLASNVGNLRHEPLAAELPGLSKYAVGDWRIFYAINHSEHQVDIHMMAHRNDLR